MDSTKLNSYKQVNGFELPPPSHDATNTHLNTSHHPTETKTHALRTPPQHSIVRLAGISGMRTLNYTLSLGFLLVMNSCIRAAADNLWGVVDDWEPENNDTWYCNSGGTAAYNDLLNYHEDTSNSVIRYFEEYCKAYILDNETSMLNVTKQFHHQLKHNCYGTQSWLSTLCSTLTAFGGPRGLNTINEWESLSCLFDSIVKLLDEKVAGKMLAQTILADGDETARKFIQSITARKFTSYNQNCLLSPSTPGHEVSVHAANFLKTRLETIPETNKIDDTEL